MKEKTDSQKIKEILFQIIDQLNKEDPSLYYLSTNEVSMEIVKYIQRKNLRSHDYELVKDLTFEDIQIYISFNSKSA